MTDTAFSFGTEQFNRIFPYYILVDSDLKIASAGRSLVKMYPVREGDDFTDRFQLFSPDVSVGDFNALKQISSQPIILRSRGMGQTLLRGQFEFLDAQNQVIFIGGPHSGSADEINNDHVSTNDLTYRDSSVEQQTQLEL